MKSILFILKISFFLMLTHTVYAQQKDLTTLESEAKSVKKSAGIKSLEYADKLLEIARYYNNNHDEAKALSTWYEVETILALLTKSLPKDYDQQLIAKNKISNLSFNVYFDKIKYYTTLKDSIKIQEVLANNSVLSNIVKTQNEDLFLILKYLYNAYGSRSIVYLEYWQQILFLLNSGTYASDLWDTFISYRINEFGENSEPHITALMALSYFYKNNDDEASFDELQKQIAPYWKEYIYKTPIVLFNDTLNDLDTLERPLFAACDDSNKTMDEIVNCSTYNLLTFIFNEIKYPAQAREENIDGMVVVKFVVTSEGIPTDFMFANNIHVSLNREVQRIMNIMRKYKDKWTPTKINNKPVPTLYTLPVKFKLN